MSAENIFEKAQAMEEGERFVVFCASKTSRDQRISDLKSLMRSLMYQSTLSP